MTARYFADTNIAVYTLDEDSKKRKRALDIMRSRPVISVQVVNEFLNTLLIKRRVDRASANRLALVLLRRCEVVSITAEITTHAMELGGRHQLNHWDALIVSAALASGCEVLYSEDMQDGQIFEDHLRIVNPFVHDDRYTG